MATDKTESSKDNPNSLFLQVPLQKANDYLTLLQPLRIINPHYKITAFQDVLFIPITHIPENPPNSEVFSSLKVFHLEDLPITISQRKIKPKLSLKEALKPNIPSKLHPLLPRAFDVIGDIAIIELNREEMEALHPFKEVIGHTILQTNPHIKTVLEKSSDIHGVYRTRAYNYVAGENRRETKYKENQTTFMLDIEKMFFTPRLSFERHRVGRIQTPFNHSGILWDMFCGIGPYFIQIAKNHPDLSILATEINPAAVNYAQRNIQLNHIQNNITCLQTDVSQFPSSAQASPFFNRVSRIIMNLPEKNLDFLPCLVPFLHPDGALLHVYQFNEKPDPLQDAREKLEQKIKDLPLQVVQYTHQRIVKPFSPALETTVLDVILKRME